ncbi:hypothetical protein AX16_003643 [Volvariella volvacea WC 439]|nr:hypothetical protein AX16_003643 [Volvariella volvacea WC 439]
MPTKRRQIKLKQPTLLGMVKPKSPSPPAKSSSKPRRRPRAPDKADPAPTGTKRSKTNVVIITSESEDDMPTKSPKERRVVRSDSESSPAPVTKGKRKAPSSNALHKRRSRRVVTSDSESEDYSPPVRNIRRKTQVKSPSTPSEEISDDLEEEHILESRLRKRDRKSIYQQNLEKLRRRKAGIREASPEKEAEEEEDTSDTPFIGAKPSGNGDSDDGDESSDGDSSSGFIVEDEGQEQAVLPFQFSMKSHQDLSDQFLRVFQFFVHIAVRAPSERHDFMERILKEEEYFSVPLQITRRKLSGIRDSQVASSVWRPEFKRPLETYPELDITELHYAIPQCDACHLGGRLSTRMGHLHGQPYDRLGFEAVDSDSDSDSDSDTDSKSKVEQPEFHLGRFCARRTRVFHEFSHWEYALFKVIQQEVDDLHTREQGKGLFLINYAGNRPPPKDLTDADAIYEWLDGRRITDMEWQRIKDMMQRAENLDAMAKRGDDLDSD